MSHQLVFLCPTVWKMLDPEKLVCVSRARVAFRLLSVLLKASVIHEATLPTFSEAGIKKEIIA